MMAARTRPVFRCWKGIEGTVRIAYKSRDGEWRNGEAFKTHEAHAINAYVRTIDTRDQDVYFTPGVYDGEVKAENLLTRNLLWADLDRKPGHEFDVAALKLLKPSMLWRTSKQGWQAVWVMPTPREDVLRVNAALTRFLMADPGGWHGAKFLRIPGSAHHGKVRHGTWDSEVAYRSHSPVWAGPTQTWEHVLDVLSADLSALGHAPRVTVTAQAVLASQELVDTPMTRATRAQFLDDDPWDGDRSRLRWTQMGTFRRREPSLKPGQLLCLMRGLASAQMPDQELAGEIARHYSKWVQR